MTSHSQVVVLTGGTGGSKFVYGLQQALGGDTLAAIGTPATISHGTVFTYHSLGKLPEPQLTHEFLALSENLKNLWIYGIPE